MCTDNTQPKVPILRTALGFLAIVLALYIGFVVWMTTGHPGIAEVGTQSSKFSEAGVFGDSFGALNALFSGLAFAGLLTAIVLQRRELQATLDELRKSVDHQKELADAATRERSDRALELFAKFRQDEMHESRTLAWNARNKWVNVAGYRERMRSAYFSTGNLSSHGLDETERKEFTAIHDVLEFYSILSLHEGADTEIRSLGFYFVWWRGFLWKVISSYEAAYEELKLNDDEKKQFPQPEWRDRITCLERRFKLSPYDETQHWLDRALASGAKHNAADSQDMPPLSS